MNIKKLGLATLATLMIIVSQAYGSALKAGLETAKSSLSSLAQTKFGKAVLDNKGKVGLAAGAYSYYAYRLYKYLHPKGINIYTVNENDVINGCFQFFSHLAITGALVNYSLDKSPSSKKNLKELLLAIAMHLFSIWAATNTLFDDAIEANDRTAFAFYLKGFFGLIKPIIEPAIRKRGLALTQDPAIAQYLFNHGGIKSIEEHVAFFQSRPGMIQWFADHGIANSSQGLSALQQVRPDIAQQTLARRCQTITKLLSKGKIKHPKSGNICPLLPDEIADRIASLTTGITIEPESAQKLEAETAQSEVMTDELQKILDNALAEWES